MVAGAAKADLLHDLRQAVDKAVQGGGIAEFRKGFAEIVAAPAGPVGGLVRQQGGRGLARGVIYQTSLMTSYAAGRRARLLDPDLIKP